MCNPAYPLQDFTAPQAAFVVKAVMPGLAGSKVKTVTGEAVTSKQLEALCSPGRAVEEWDMAGVLLFRPGSKTGTREDRSPQQYMAEFTK